MRAAAVSAFDPPLELQELPTPVPRGGEVVVRIEFGGRCGTDIDAVHRDRPARLSLPLTAGTEGTGNIEEPARMVLQL